MALLNITNYDDHPEDPNWIVFRFGRSDLSVEFRSELDKVGIAYQSDGASEPPFLVAVKQRHRELAVRANYLVLGRHRSPFLADGILRWLVLIGVGALVTLALVGYFMAS
ncbi:MAG: hypothetical protein IPO05_12405 [Flavobacteriales bacterium]|jgi:hypothetical protein|nr:hypothetical protein [Flavobacteriales bacterium]MBK9514390.1 hypothetical protein [Flavobacteriales bacterium]MBP7449627.1 hypothetical protein [Flavobacteriales bacterium]HOZ40249.1 hypothetical protein [Flavobacteriales bacterium]